MFNDRENKISKFPHYKLKFSAFTDVVFKSKALGLSFESLAIASNQTMINTGKSKITMQKNNSTIAKANNLPHGNGNTNFIT